jgi:putative transposase
MIRFSFKKGLVFIELNRRWQLNRRLVTTKLQFENELGEIKTLTDAEVLALWSKGEWVVDENSLGTQGC